jgi:hypothetical protein
VTHIRHSHKKPRWSARKKSILISVRCACVCFEISHRNCINKNNEKMKLRYGCAKSKKKFIQFIHFL